MNYPKKLMTINELVEIGYSAKVLRGLYQKSGYPLAFKETGTRTCPIKFDTELLDRQMRLINERRMR